jgi:hypothetical protein
VSNTSKTIALHKYPEDNLFCFEGDGGGGGSGVPIPGGRGNIIRIEGEIATYAAVALQVYLGIDSCCLRVEVNISGTVSAMDSVEL